MRLGAVEKVTSACTPQRTAGCGLCPHTEASVSYLEACKSTHTEASASYTEACESTHTEVSVSHTQLEVACAHIQKHVCLSVATAPIHTHVAEHGAHAGSMCVCA